MAFQVSKLNATCIKCGKPVNKGDRIWWTLESRGLEHDTCHGPEPEPLRTAQPFKKKRVAKENRCPKLKTLMGMTAQCIRERHEEGGHSYEFKVGNEFWDRVERAKDTDTLADIIKS